MGASVSSIFNAIVQFLPGSPFQRYIQAVGELPYLAEINWFIPVGEMIAIAQAWVFAIGLYYVYSVILRTINVIS